MVWSVEAYVDARGSTPVRDFYLKHGRPKRVAKSGNSVNQDWARLEWIIKEIIEPQEGGLRPHGASFHTVEEFWQIRTDQIRVLCLIDKSRKNVLVMLHPSKKKQQKTPPEDILIARNIAKEFG